MILLDAQGLVALLTDEPAAADVEVILEQHGAAMTPTNLAEAIDISERVLGVESATVRLAIETLRDSVLHIVPCSEDDAWRAARIRTRRYHGRHSPISICDAFLLAAASPGDAIASADAGVVSAARAEGLDVIPLANSRGKKPR